MASLQQGSGCSNISSCDTEEEYTEDWMTFKKQSGFVRFVNSGIIQGTNDFPVRSCWLGFRLIKSSNDPD